MDLTQIESNLLAKISDSSEGLLSGNAGKYFYFIEKNQNNDLLIEKSFTKIVDSKNVDVDFCTGLSGYLYFLDKSDFKLDSSDLRILHQVLLNKFCFYLQNHNWDFLSGALGIAIALLPLNRKPTQDLVVYFEKNKTMFEGDSCFWFSSLYPNTSNFSLAHGIASIIQFLSICLNENILESKAKKLLRLALNYILKYQGIFKEYNSLFPSYISYTSGVNSMEYSRLAWCYGDLSMAWTMLNASKVLDDKDLKQNAIEIAKETTKRKEVDDTMVGDASICHGSSGVAYLYYKFFLETEEIIFKTTYEYWILKSESFLLNNDYKFLNRHLNKWVDDISLLEGLAGVAFCMRSISQKGQTAWDRCLLLS